MLKKNIFFIILCTFIFYGCVYYNTFFNAKKYFAEAQDIELKEDGKPTSNAINKYNKTIKKCGVVLSDYKDSEYADDALFLMARSLFYIGRNYTQAIEKFNDLIKFYPESEFVPDAKIYIARAKYEFGKKQEAYELLHEFLLDAESKDYHPKALKVLANFQLKNKDYVEAEYYLAKIIENYPKYDEYESVFFLLGKTKNESGNYKESNEVFTSLLKSRVSKKIKLDSRYYIAYNHLLLKDHKQSKKFINKLLKDEYRESHISKIQLLKARILTGLEETDKAIPIFETVINDNKRSMLSAEASFYLAELFFTELKDYTRAIEYYNKVKKEYKDSDFVTRSVKKSAIASQIIQYYNPDAAITTETLVLQQLKLAEYYIENLNMPDSAIIVYDKIIGQKEGLIAKLDSLNFQMNNINSILDSLLIQDSVLVQTVQDSVLIKSKIETDSLLVLEEPDSLSKKIAVEDKGIISTEMQVELEKVKQNIRKVEEDIVKFNDEFIPFSRFVKIWIYKTILNDTLMTNDAFWNLENNHPGNKYTYAASMLLNDKEVHITTEKQKRELEEYQNAIDFMETNPERSVEMLIPLAEIPEHDFSDKATFAIGFINYFVLADSTLAKQYLDELLNKENSEYVQDINKFYDGKYFKSLNRLPYIQQLEEVEKIKAEQDTLASKEKIEPVDENSETREKIKSEEMEPETIPEQKEPGKELEIKEEEKTGKETDIFEDIIIPGMPDSLKQEKEIDEIKEKEILPDTLEIIKEQPDSLKKEEKAAIEKKIEPPDSLLGEDIKKKEKNSEPAEENSEESGNAEEN